MGAARVAEGLAIITNNSSHFIIPCRNVANSIEVTRKPKPAVSAMRQAIKIALRSHQPRIHARCCDKGSSQRSNKAEVDGIRGDVSAQ